MPDAAAARQRRLPDARGAGGKGGLEREGCPDHGFVVERAAPQACAARRVCGGIDADDSNVLRLSFALRWAALPVSPFRQDLVPAGDWSGDERSAAVLRVFDPMAENVILDSYLGGIACSI